jgi:hypothetical protein
MVYHGPKFTEELVHYDPTLVVGILGGASGTTYDAFKLIAESQKYGAKVALFGRKINNAEHQLAFVQMLRRIVDGNVGPEEAVAAYHAVLQGLGIQPYRSLQDDLQLTNPVMSYVSPASTATRVSMSARPSAGATTVAQPTATARALTNGGPDFAKMTKEERLAYHRKRLARMMG